MTGVRFVLVKTSQLTTVDLWKRFDYISLESRVD